MKKQHHTIHLSKMEHRGDTRIKVVFEIDQALISKMKGRKWSQTKRCWHLPYLKESFENLEKVFGVEGLIYPSKQSLVASKRLVTSYQISNQDKMFF